MCAVLGPNLRTKILLVSRQVGICEAYVSTQSIFISIPRGISISPHEAHFMLAYNYGGNCFLFMICPDSASASQVPTWSAMFVFAG